MTGLQEKWINALESGQYKQGKGQLRNSKNEFCCLGVLCDIHDNTKWKGGVGCYRYGLTNTMFSPLDLEAIVGINGKASELVKMNDTGSTFQEIATYLRGVFNGQ